jgi:hypothetical protein
MAGLSQDVKQLIKQRGNGMRYVGETTIMDNSNKSYRLTPDKSTVLAAGEPDSAEQYVDHERGLILIDLGGDDAGD